MAVSAKGAISAPAEGYRWRVRSRADARYIVRRKTEIEEDTLEEFQRNGTAHILAVSGLHIGILYGVLGKLWRGKKDGCTFGW